MNTHNAQKLFCLFKTLQWVAMWFRDKFFNDRIFTITVLQFNLTAILQY
jgi:hypothetical protein